MPDAAADPARTPSPLVRSGRSRLRRLRRAVLARRRSLAAVCVVLAVISGARATARPPEPVDRVVVATADLAGGRALTAADLVTVDFRAGSSPAGAMRDPAAAVGRVLAAPLRRGEPVTDVRMVAPGLLRGYPGLVAAPVRVADEAAVRLLRVGDEIDLLGADPQSGRAAVVAADAAVLAIPRRQQASSDLAGGALVVLAVDESTALALAEASVSSVLSVLLGG